jgi:hypothetical protein
MTAQHLPGQLPESTLWHHPIGCTPCLVARGGSPTCVILGALRIEAAWATEDIVPVDPKPVSAVREDVQQGRRGCSADCEIVAERNVCLRRGGVGNPVGPDEGLLKSSSDGIWRRLRTTSCCKERDSKGHKSSGGPDNESTFTAQKLKLLLQPIPKKLRWRGSPRAPGVLSFQVIAHARGHACGGASYTFGALAILVVAPGRKPGRVKVPEACRSPPLPSSPEHGRNSPATHGGNEESGV